jgi:hypothetical protein
MTIPNGRSEKMRDLGRLSSADTEMNKKYIEY